jgi:hypothetical protein
MDELKVSRRGGMRDGEWKCQGGERREVGGVCILGQGRY